MTGESKKKILYIITKSVWAGAGKYTRDLAVSLPRNEFEPMVAAGGKGAMAEKLISAGIPYFEIKGFQRDVSFQKDIRAFFEILALLFKIKPDTVHVSSAKAGGIAGAAILAYKLFTSHFSLIACFTAHGWTFNEPRPRWQIALIKFFSKITCLFYNKIICVSEYDYSIALKNKIAKPEEYEFLSREEARKAISHQLSAISRLEAWLPSEVWVGTIGEFTRNKGYKFLIDAVKKLSAVCSRLSAVLIGFDGGKKKDLESRIKNGELSDKVFLVEDMPDAAKYLKAFDIFVLPSLKEGLPYVLLEAGLAGLPIVASNVGGIPEIIENEKTGILTRPANADELANAIKKLIENPEMRNKLSTATREKILQDFSFKKMLEETIRLYRKN